MTDCSSTSIDVTMIPIDVNSESSMDNFFENYHTIALETLDECIMADIDKIEISDKLYCLDKKRSTIFVFDKDGHFIDKIDRKGSGPDEYFDIADFSVDNSNIYILSRVGRKINVYSKETKFIKSFALNDFYDYMYISYENAYLHSNYSNNTKHNVAVFNFEKKLIINNFLPFKVNQSFSFLPTPFNESLNGDLLMTQQYDYNIYKLHVDSINVIYRIEFNTKYQIPDNFQEIGFEKIYQKLAQKSVVTRIDYVTQSAEYLYIIYKLNGLNKISKIDKTRMSVISLNLEYNDQLPFVFSNPLGFYNDCLVGYLPAYAVLMFDKKFISDKTKNGLLGESDNPVLFFHKLK
ncbi:6-bladed beta-propeller [Bacteroidia bacterium]|nr:6-bladed beta-propeller [Bacteroidia bacterium]